MELVSFITTETGTDLIVSFAISIPDDPTDIESLTIIRTPKFEGLLYEWERGAKVSFDRDEPDDEVVLLREVKYSPEDKTVVVCSDQHTYELDIRKVETSEVKQMRAVFLKMNFDRSIKLEGI